MDLSHIKQKFLKHATLGEVEKILGSISTIVTSFIYANISLSRLSVYVVFKNSGGYKLFKTIDNKILVDKLDNSFTESRELVGLSSWNIKKIYRIRVDRDRMVLDRLKLKDLSVVLFSLIEPEGIKYVVGLEEGNTPVVLNFSNDTFNGVEYKELKDCMLASYSHSLRLQGREGNYVIEPSFYAVDYN